MADPGHDHAMPGVVLLITTNRRAERFIPHVGLAVGAAWESHPPCVFLTDGEAAAADVMAFAGQAFVPMMLSGIDRIAGLHSTATHVFHLLEDHAPLKAVDGRGLGRFLRTAMRHGLAATSFVTYRWPWDETDQRLYDDRRVRTWRRIDVATFDGAAFARVPRDFFRYFQLQPTLWRMDYLKAVLEEALSLGVVDPWGFEALWIDGAEQHYVAAYDWPSVHHGFLKQGRVNHEAVRFIDRAALPEFRRVLMAD